MRVLLIEDDALLSKAVKMTLADDGVVVHTTSMGEEGVSLAKLYDYDAILLDLNLPDLSGMDVLKQLRTAKVTTPVMVLSGQIDTQTKVKALDAGADDYITKPFHNYELTARVRALVRRSKGYAASTIVIGDLVLNLDSKTVEVAGSRVPVSTKEYQILELLCLRKGATLTKEVFLNHLYGEIDEPDPKIIDVFVCKLRKKLVLATGGYQHIETIWGRGYLVRDQQAEPAAIAA
jgi:two-component system, cell cycle response regulator CtrA